MSNLQVQRLRRTNLAPKVMLLIFWIAHLWYHDRDIVCRNEHTVVRLDDQLQNWFWKLISVKSDIEVFVIYVWMFCCINKFVVRLGLILFYQCKSYLQLLQLGIIMDPELL